MRRVRIESGAEEGRAEVTGGEARHLVKVLRLTAGDAVVAFDGRGGEWEATIARASSTKVVLALGAARARRTESPCAVLLGQAVGKGDKLDLVVRAATELGVAEVSPVLSARAVATGEGGGKVERWRRIAVEACKQCGRSVVPAIHPPESLAAFFERAASAPLKVVPWEGGGEPLAVTVARASAAAGGRLGRAALLVGPEGGFGEAEIDAATRAGFVSVTLGPRVLRTETAGIVAVAAVQLLAGDLGAAGE